MAPTAPPEATPPPTLHGSLDAFPLFTVLALLATTGQTGELNVLSDRGAGRVWVDGGRLANAQVGQAATIGQAVFDLARVDGGEFEFYPGRRSSSGQPTVPVDAVLDEVRPLVERWEDLVELVPLDALVGLAAEPAGAEVRLGADQWRALSAVAAGAATVRDALDRSADEPLATLTVLRTLFDEGLVTLDPAPRARPRTRAADVPVGTAQDRPEAVPVPESIVGPADTALGGLGGLGAWPVDGGASPTANRAATAGSAPVAATGPPAEVAASAGANEVDEGDEGDAGDAAAEPDEEAVEEPGGRTDEASERPSPSPARRPQTPWTLPFGATDAPVAAEPAAAAEPPEATEPAVGRRASAPPADPSAPDPEPAPVFGLRRLAEVTLLPPPPPSPGPWSDADPGPDMSAPDSTEPSRPAAGRTTREAPRGPASQGNGAA